MYPLGFVTQSLPFVSRNPTDHAMATCIQVVTFLLNSNSGVHDTLLLLRVMSSGVSMASRVAALLKSRLSATAFQRFTPQDIESLVGKRFLDEAAFAEATKEVLQDLPGEPLPGLLINSILKAFNPSALRAQGKTSQRIA